MDALNFLLSVGAVCAFLASLGHYVRTLDSMDFRGGKVPYWRFLAVGLGRIGLCVLAAGGTVAIVQGVGGAGAYLLVLSLGLLSVGKGVT
jgi:hypothetical protein